MGLFKKIEYLLLDLETEEEAGRYRDPFLIGDARRMMKTGEIEEGIYALIEYNVKSGVQKTLWKMKQKKKLTADEAAKLDREKALQAVKDRADSLKSEVADFEQFRDGVLKKFGVEGEDGVATEVEIPDSVDSIKKALNIGMSRALYRDIMREEGKMGSNFFKMFEGVNELINSGARYLSHKVDEVNSKPKDETSNEKRVEKEVETRDDGTTITRFKRKKEKVEEELPIISSIDDIERKDEGVEDEIEPEIIRGRVISSDEEEQISENLETEEVFIKDELVDLVIEDHEINKNRACDDEVKVSIEKELDIEQLEEKLKELEDKRRDEAEYNSVKKKNKLTKKRKKK